MGFVSWPGEDKTLSAELQHVSGIKGLALYFVFRAFIGRQLAFFV